MPFDWNQYINLGRQLSEQGNPASLRAGISRGYYGVYNLLRISVGLTTRYRPHKELIETLASAPQYDDQRMISKLLQDLKQDREVADYDGFAKVDNNYSLRFWLRLDSVMKIHRKNVD